MTPIYKPSVYNLDIDVNYLIKNIPWVEVKSMRKECFMSSIDRDYQYDKLGHVYSSVPFDTEVEQIMDHLNQSNNFGLNVCFLNYYENDKKALGWHADDAPQIDHNEPIAVVSFGAERDIWWKPMGYKGEIPDQWRQKLGNGSLFIMPPGMQSTHYHRIPKGDREMSARVSLTFRRYKDN